MLYVQVFPCVHNTDNGSQVRLSTHVSSFRLYRTLPRQRTIVSCSHSLLGNWRLRELCVSNFTNDLSSDWFSDSTNLIPWYNTSKKRKSERAVQELAGIVISLVAARKREGRRENDPLQYLIDLQDSDAEICQVINISERGNWYLLTEL